MENTELRELEQLRHDYSILKEKIEAQEIINDRLMRSTFKTKVKSIHSVAWTQTFCAAFVVLTAPITFRHEPLNLSWGFVIATEIMMFACTFITWMWHLNVTEPEPGKQSLKEFAENLRDLKKKYKTWMRWCYLIIVPWIAWMSTEIIMKSEDPKFAIAILCGLLFGGLIGGIIGIKLDKKVLSGCDEIIRQIEE